ncbi:MAG: hypothetical protein EXR74_04205 [Bdellovibrionales bacterium]|nr:hypothetical protein [Bdellovibrionales bacterium]
MTHLVLIYLGLCSILFGAEYQTPPQLLEKSLPGIARPEYLSSLSGSQNRITENFKTHELLSPRGNAFKLSVLPAKKCVDIFKELAEQKYIPFCYPEDGCYARAHEMTRVMEKKGIIAGKIFLEGALKVETKNSPKGYVEWRYHVVPLVAVREGGWLVLNAMDPSVANSPLTIKEWVAIQTSHPKGKITALYTTPRFNYTPSDKMKELTDYRIIDLAHTQKTLQTYLTLQTTRSKLQE